MNTLRIYFIVIMYDSILWLIDAGDFELDQSSMNHVRSETIFAIHNIFRIEFK